MSTPLNDIWVPLCYAPTGVAKIFVDNQAIYSTVVAVGKNTN